MQREWNYASKKLTSGVHPALSRAFASAPFSIKCFTYKHKITFRLQWKTNRAYHTLTAHTNV